MHHTSTSPLGPALAAARVRYASTSGVDGSQAAVHVLCFDAGAAQHDGLADINTAWDVERPARMVSGRLAWLFALLLLSPVLEAARAACLSRAIWHSRPPVLWLQAPRAGFRRCCVMKAALPPVPKVDARTLSRGEFAEYERGHPVVLTHAFAAGGEVAGRLTDEEYCDLLLETMGDVDVDYMVKEYRKGALRPRTRFYTSPLMDFVEQLQVSSRHDRGWYLLSEDLLDSPPGMVVDARLRHSLDLPVSLFGEDLFRLFPGPVRPRDRCVIIGGQGARSHLHADPFEWVGVNYLLEGRKKWVFLPPSVEDREEERIAPKRLPPAAWDGMQDFNVSAGWVSDYDLYRHGADDVTAAGAEGVGLWEGAMEVVQEEGELVVIPPHWWHQVYHLEPSFCVASQYTNVDNLPTVIRHMLEWCGMPAGEVAREVEACHEQLGALALGGKEQQQQLSPLTASQARAVQAMVERVVERGRSQRRPAKAAS